MSEKQTDAQMRKDFLELLEKFDDVYAAPKSFGEAYGTIQGFLQCTARDLEKKARQNRMEADLYSEVWPVGKRIVEKRKKDKASHSAAFHKVRAKGEAFVDVYGKSLGVWIKDSDKLSQREKDLVEWDMYKRAARYFGDMALSKAEALERQKQKH